MLVDRGEVPQQAEAAAGGLLEGGLAQLLESVFLAEGRRIVQRMHPGTALPERIHAPRGGGFLGSIHTRTGVIRHARRTDPLDGFQFTHPHPPRSRPPPPRATGTGNPSARSSKAPSASPP